MSIESDFIWFDGELRPYADSQVHVMSHTLHYGLGAFEGIRAYTQPDGRAGVWRLDDHLERFLDSLRMCHLPSSRWTREQLAQACMTTLEANHFTEAYLRPLGFLGTGAMGLGARSNPLHVIIASWRWGAYMGDEGLRKGVRLKTASFVRHHPNAALQRAKVIGHYVNNILARYEANDAGYDEALMLDNNGYVAEGTGENIFVVERDGTVLTPPGMNILPGITRASILEILAHEGIPHRQQSFGRDALYTAAEAFMVGTAAEVTPIRNVDGVDIPNTPGPVTRRVQKIYLDAVRGKVDWLAHHITH